MRQSMPLSSIESCAGVSETFPLRLRPDESTALQVLGQQQQPLIIEPQHLEHVATLAAEDEGVTVERVGLQRRLRHR